MTPGARVAAAIEIIDEIRDGQPAEKALTRWARGHRFAGSKDRAAIRDYVFDVLRHWRSDAARGGADSGRARMIGRVRDLGIDPDTLFNGQGHAPAPLTTAELNVPLPADLPVGDAWDLPDWLVSVLEESMGADAAEAATALTSRAPVTLRVNVGKTTRAMAQARLADDGIETRINPRASTALTVTDGARRLRNSTTYLNGLVEIQDAASQASVADLGASGRALDLCAGGGGKSLALAALGWAVVATDVDPTRMRDLPDRAARGGHEIAICDIATVRDLAPFDLVFVDAPCSGAGTWRRSPEAKWALTPERLGALTEMQREVLDTAAALTRVGGTLVYATCSILDPENMQQVDAFAERHAHYSVDRISRWDVNADGDGFFRAILTRNT